MTKSNTANSEPDEFEISAALDHPLPAPIGARTVMFIVTDYSEDENYTVFQNTFRDEEEGLIGLARWCLYYWSDWEDDTPWFEDGVGHDEGLDRLAEKWLATRTAKEVVDAFFDRMRSFDYTVEETVITRVAPWKNAGEVIELAV